MKLCDDAAVIAATRLAGGRVVTAAVDAMQFRSPVHVGDLVTLRSQVNAAWRTSMEVGVRVDSENVATGEILHTCTAYLTMVALGEDAKPVPLPELAPDTPDEHRRHRSAPAPPGDPARRPGRVTAHHLDPGLSDGIATSRAPGAPERARLLGAFAPGVRGSGNDRTDELAGSRGCGR